MRELIRQTHEGVYGDGDKHVGVNEGLCASVIEHSDDSATISSSRTMR